MCVAGGSRRAAAERTLNMSYLSSSMGLPIISDDAFSLRVNRACSAFSLSTNIRPIWPAPPSPDTPAGKSISLRGNDYQNPKPLALGVLFVGRRPEARNASGGRLSLFLLQFPRGGCNDAADLRKLPELYKKLRECGQ